MPDNFPYDAFERARNPRYRRLFVLNASEGGFLAGLPATARSTTLPSSAG
jgi:hypothetical protein